MTSCLMVLAKTNHFRQDNGVHVHDHLKTFDYSDGSDIEKYLLKVFEHCSDLSSCSAELDAHIRDWVTEYHLSNKRANLLRAFDFSEFEHALDLGCGCGAISRYLGEQGVKVDAVEGSAARARLATLRCRDLDQVTVYNANFNQLELPKNAYDAVVLVGVTEYAARFMDGSTSSEDAVKRMLMAAREALTEGGLIIVAIENRLGMKYVLGAHEDHYSRRYIGIHDYFGEHDIKTYSLAEWKAMFIDAGLFDVSTYLPFPDYKVPTVVLSEQFATEDPNAYCHLEGLASRDYVVPTELGATEPVFWQAASASGALAQYSNSFLFLCGEGPDIQRLDFAHLPSFTRKNEFSVITRKPEHEDKVTRERIAGSAGGDQLFRQELIEEKYLRGKLLSVEWTRALSIAPDSGRFLELVRTYLAYLDTCKTLSIDLLPKNIVVDVDGKYHPFDQEWVTDRELSSDYLLFRALLSLSLISMPMARPFFKLHQLATVRDFIVFIGRQAGRDLESAISEHVRLEEAFQSTVSRTNQEQTTLRHLETRVLDAAVAKSPNQVKIYWKGLGADYTREQSRAVFVDACDDIQTIRFNLPPDAGQATYIRFDPCDERCQPGVGFMRIYSIEAALVEPTEDAVNSEVIWRLSGQQEIADNALSSGISYKKTEFGEMFAVTDGDPWLSFRFIPRRMPLEHQYLEIRVVVRMPVSRDYLLAKDMFLTTDEKLKRKLDTLESAEKTIEELEGELLEIKESRAWRAVSTYRQMLHHHFTPQVARSKRWLGLLWNHGPRHFIERLRDEVRYRVLKEEVPGAGVPTRYELWRERHFIERRDAPNDGPVISVVMPVFNAPQEILKRAVESVFKQTYRNLELCIADDASSRAETLEYLRTLGGDPRVKIAYLKENLNISGATNEAAKLATGDYIALMDNDDELALSALAEVAKAINSNHPDIIYTDEDFIKTDGHLDLPHFKTDFNPDLLLSHNYITHLLVMRRDLFEESGGLRGSYDGAQDYDLILRLTDQPRNIHHIPKPLYHWRMTESSTSMNPDIKSGANDKARAAVRDAVARRNIDADVQDTDQSHYFRVRRRLNNRPLVSIVIPFKDKAALLKHCVGALLENSSYDNYEVLGVSNDSIAASVYDEMRALETSDRRVRFVEHNIEFNFSRIVNFGVEQAKGDHVILLNNDIEIITEDWIESLLEHSQRPEIAAVGGKLYYPNNTIQHAGIMIGLGGYAGHPHKGFPAYSSGYFNRLKVVQNITALTGALMMVKKDLYASLGGFDEELFSVAYNDVDFCLRAREAGYLNVFTPYVEAYHRESISRGYEDTAEKKLRFAREMNNLLERHGALIKRGDPYYNPNFDPGRDNFSILVD